MAKKEKKKVIDICRVSRLAWIGTIVSFFVPFVGQILTLVAMSRMDKWYDMEKEDTIARHGECDKLIADAKTPKEEVSAT